MNISTLQERINHIVGAMELLISQRFVGPALILLYALLDIMASLNHDENPDNVRRSDFILWVENYMLPDSGFFFVQQQIYTQQDVRCFIHTARIHK